MEVVVLSGVEGLVTLHAGAVEGEHLYARGLGWYRGARSPQRCAGCVRAVADLAAQAAPEVAVA